MVRCRSSGRALAESREDSVYLGFEVQGLGFRLWDLGFREKAGVEGFMNLGFRV